MMFSKVKSDEFAEIEYLACIELEIDALWMTQPTPFSYPAFVDFRFIIYYRRCARMFPPIFGTDT